MARGKQQQTFVERESFTKQELERAIVKLNRRVNDLDAAIASPPNYESGETAALKTKIRDTIGEIYGQQSSRYNDAADVYLPYWMYANVDDDSRCQQIFRQELVDAKQKLVGLISLFEEKLEDLEPGASASAQDEIWNWMHKSIIIACRKKFDDGHFADAVETGLKAVNERVKQCVKKRAGQELDGAPLMNHAFSPNAPIIHLADLSTGSGKSEQQGYMQIFAGAMIGIRNPKAHANLVISPERAIQHLMLASLLMSKLDDAGI